MGENSSMNTVHGVVRSSSPPANTGNNSNNDSPQQQQQQQRQAKDVACDLSDLNENTWFSIGKILVI